jgi:MerR HTH family regulatory protein
MENEPLIPIELFRTHYQVEFSFIHSLSEHGLVEITTVEGVQYMHKDQVKDLEKMIRLHFDLDINIEGIEAIYHLLQRMDSLQDELNAMRNRLRLYEGE